ncbi:myb-like protein Q [Panonychus citri]|uniref:myb-like protein Q n=1 Tax=Panonychus citri TaxID=50023 RepID=UPI002307E9EB|nr:myb-like protein Q [Panonychus citri]
METNDCYNLDTRKLLSLEGQTWSHIDFGLDEDSSSNDIEDSKSDTSSTITTNGGITYNSFGVSDTMKLKEEDMYLFGVCPAYDPFFLAVCEYCGQVIKPQALAKHIELRHRSFPSDSIDGKSDNLSHDQLDDSCNAQSSIHLLPGMKGITHRIGSNGDNLNTHSLISGRSTLFSSDNKNDSNKHILLEAIPPGSSSSSPLSFGHPNNQSITSGTSHLKSSSSLLNQSGTNSPFNNLPALSSCSSAASSPNSSNSSQTLVANNNQLNNSRYGSSQLTANKTDLVGGNTLGSNGAKTKSSNNLLVKKASIRGKLLPCKDREYDADKHCGVKIGDMDKPCTRSLTCKTHSLTLRRSVAERSKNFDDLLTEHRANKEAALRAAGIEVKPTKQQLKQRELEAKRLLLLQQQQQKSQPQQKQQKQQHAPSSQSKLDQSNSHQQQAKSSKQYNSTHQQSQPQQPPHHHLRHHSNHIQDNISLPVSSHSHHQNQQQQQQQLKEINSTVSQCNQNLMIGKRLDKHSPILARQLNETIDSKSDTKSSTPPPIQPTPAIIPSTSSPTPPNYSTNQLDKPNFIEVDGCLYLPNPPKPMALCNFNARQISIEPLNCDQDDSPCNLSSRLFTRKRDLTYSALTIFRTQSKTDGSNSRPNNQKLLSLLNSN